MKDNRLGSAASVLIAAFVLVSSGAVHAQNFYSISGTLSLNSTSTTTRLIGPRTGTAQGTGVGTVPFAVPTDLFLNTGSASLFFPNYPSVAQLVSSFTTSHPAINVAGGAGPGSFAFCPGVANPANPTCSAPGLATGGFNGLIQYTAGPNQFGGTMQLIRKQVGSVSRRIATNPSQFSHTPRTISSTWPPGAAMSNTRIIVPQPGVITQSPVLGPSGQIQTLGIYIGPGPVGPTGFETGQPLTTGKIVLKDSVPSVTTFTLSGYDSRTAAGSGVIQLVGGSYIQRPTGLPAQAFPRQTTLTLTLPEPATTTGLALGMTALLGLERMRRRARRGGSPGLKRE